MNLIVPPQNEDPGGESSAEAAGLLSIGELAQATGVSADTIRVWERRYGRPDPVRLESGHRRYTRVHVRWLRQVAEAIARGHRPSLVVRMSDEEMRGILLAGAPDPAPAAPIQRLVQHARRFEGDVIARELRAAAADLGPRAFLDTIIVPLLEAVGRAWVDGELDIRHEHYLSGLLEDVLREMRGKVSVPARAPVVALATLSGEAHGIGLQMLGIYLRTLGVRAEVIGTHTPAHEVAAAAEELGAAAVALSVSMATGGVDTDRVIADLRRLLPEGMRLLVGGRGARGVRRGPRGVDHVADWAALERWCAQLPASG